ncbi:peptidylprolyl isomerase [Psychroserpens damuponensis]|uniref:peptidylprolyl isomerase n=1 Tax=Psychroserpens damuponensis TaxID=943936 RepID=UPI0005913BBC|nr:peptidylprolyl isomerase [Psychroserpens damuponensis]
MLKNLLVTALLFSTTIVIAQKDFEKSLDSIQTLDDVTIFFKKNNTVKGKVIVFNEEKHKTRMAEDILNMGLGSKKYFKDAPQKTYYKVIEKNEIPYYRVSCVYIDGRKRSIKDVNIIRNQVIAKYQDGYRFTDLAKQFSMDNTAKQGGDLGWFTNGDLHPEFERQVIEGDYRKDDIFKIDIPDISAYYVVLITHDKRLIKESKVLKVTEPRK